jgi:hypothetical protein
MPRETGTVSTVSALMLPQLAGLHKLRAPVGTRPRTATLCGQFPSRFIHRTLLRTGRVALRLLAAAPRCVG